MKMMNRGDQNITNNRMSEEQLSKEDQSRDKTTEVCDDVQSEEVLHQWTELRRLK